MANTQKNNNSSGTKNSLDHFGRRPSTKIHQSLHQSRRERHIHNHIRNDDGDGDGDDGDDGDDQHSARKPQARTPLSRLSGNGGAVKGAESSAPQCVQESLARFKASSSTSPTHERTRAGIRTQTSKDTDGDDKAAGDATPSFMKATARSERLRLDGLAKRRAASEVGKLHQLGRRVGLRRAFRHQTEDALDKDRHRRLAENQRLRALDKELRRKTSCTPTDALEPIDELSPSP